MAINYIHTSGHASRLDIRPLTLDIVLQAKFPAQTCLHKSASKRQALRQALILIQRPTRFFKHFQCNVHTSNQDSRSFSTAVLAHTNHRGKSEVSQTSPRRRSYLPRKLRMELRFSRKFFSHGHEGATSFLFRWQYTPCLSYLQHACLVCSSACLTCGCARPQWNGFECCLLPNE